KHQVVEVLSPGAPCVTPGLPGQFACRVLANDKTKTGWTAGAGAEMMLGDSAWSIAVEYLFVDLGDTKLSLRPNGNEFFTITSKSRYADRSHLIRAKIIYPFGGPVLPGY